MQAVINNTPMNTFRQCDNKWNKTYNECDVHISITQPSLLQSIKYKIKNQKDLVPTLKTDDIEGKNPFTQSSFKKQEEKTYKNSTNRGILCCTAIFFSIEIWFIKSILFYWAVLIKKRHFLFLLSRRKAKNENILRKQIRNHKSPELN